MYTPLFLKTDLNQREEWKLNRLILPGIILILSIASYAINDAYPSFHQFWACLIWLLLFLLALFFLLQIQAKKGKDNLNFDSIKDWAEKNNPQVTQEGDSPGTIQRILARIGISSPSNNISVGHSRGPGGLWSEYYEYSRPHHCLNRVVTIWLFFAIIETVLIYLLPPWPWPCRGSTCHWVYWTGVTSFVAIMILLFFILDAVMLSFFWIQMLHKQLPSLVHGIAEKDRNTRNATRNKLKSLENVIAAVAKRTAEVDKLIYFPMLCIMLMLFAKITYFDNQDFPLSKAITFAASISLLFFSGFMLRREAKRLKLSVIECAKGLSKNHESNQMKAVATTIEKINGIDEGAFQPMFEQPVLRALLIILASISLFASEYLKLLG